MIGEYYPFWWKITSGGQSRTYQNLTAIVELDAATGEVYLEDIQKTVLGSAGHALELKVNTRFTENLNIVLIEKDTGCYAKLKNVIRQRWPSVPIEEAESLTSSNSSRVYLLNTALEDALEAIENLELGNALYFFDPLRHVEYATIEKVASKRMDTFYKTGTEFMIFLFTSDWFLGRRDFAPLPCTLKENTWTEKEKETVSEADALFGNTKWRKHILNNKSIEEKERTLIEIYKNRLHRWFRYILPLPFNPKENQLFHLILCSNYEAGIRATRNFYADKTGNPKYSPDNPSAFSRFNKLHPKLFRGLEGRRRPLQWLILWNIITQHEEGICDHMCRDFRKKEISISEIKSALEWLADQGYLEQITIENAWDSSITQYKLNWEIVKERLGVDPPASLIPVSPEDYRDEDKM